MNLRKQFHFRLSANGFYAWSVDKLVKLSQDLPVIKIELTQVAEVDEPYWYGSRQDVPTVRSIAAHMQLITEADTRFPIILSADGRIMDGMHRVAKALLNNQKTIDAVRFNTTPPPDFVDVQPDELTYD